MMLSLSSRNVPRLPRSAALTAFAIVISAIGFSADAAVPPPNSTLGLPDAGISDASVRKLLVDAQNAMRSGNIRLALILLKNAASAAPKNGTIRAELGLVLLQSNNLPDAERELRQARADGAPNQLVLPGIYRVLLARHEEQKLLDEFPDPGVAATGPDVADLLKVRSLALQAIGRSADAVSAMDRSLVIRRDISGILTRARLAYQQGDRTMAKTLSDEAVSLGPKNVDALMFKLGLLMQANDNATVLALSDTITKLFPNNLAVRLARIETYLKLKQDAKANAEVTAILAKAPNAAIGMYYKALLMARAGDVKGAWNITQSLPAEFTQTQPSIAIMVSQMAVTNGHPDTADAILSAALSKSPDVLDLRIRLAALRLKQQSPEGALSVLREVKDSSDPRVLALFSQCYLRLGRYQDALDALRKLGANGAPSTEMKRELALLELKSGKADVALKDLAALVAERPTDPTAVASLVAALIQAKRFPDALAAVDRLGTDPKQKAQALYLRGQVLLMQGDTNGALNAFQATLQLNPKNAAALYYRASLFEAQVKYAEAVRDLQAVLTIDPKNQSALIKLAEIAARQGNYDGALGLLTKAVGLSPKDPAPRIAMVRFLAARHDDKAALKAAQDLLQVSPNNADGFALLGDLQLRAGLKTEAIATFRKLASLRPRDGAPQILLANALFASGDLAGAAGALNAASTLDPSSIRVRAAQVNLLLAQGDINGAVTVAKQYQAASPGAAADLLVAGAMIKGKQLPQAAAVLTKSLSDHPSTAVLLRLVQIEAASGDRKKAQNQMADWLNKNPQDQAARTEYATMLQQDGDLDDAAQQFELVLKGNPSNVAALNNLGWILQTKDPKRALELLSRAMKLSPNSADVVDTFAWIKFQMKDVSGSLPLLARAHELSPGDGEIAYHLVLALNAAGKRDEASKLLRQLLASGIKFADLDKARQLGTTQH